MRRSGERTSRNGQGAALWSRVAVPDETLEDAIAENDNQTNNQIEWMIFVSQLNQWVINPKISLLEPKCPEMKIGISEKLDARKSSHERHAINESYCEWPQIRSRKKETWKSDFRNIFCLLNVLLIISRRKAFKSERHTPKLCPMSWRETRESAEHAWRPRPSKLRPERVYASYFIPEPLQCW